MSPALPTFSTSLVSITRTSLTLRHRWIRIACNRAGKPPADSPHNAPRAIARGVDRIPQVAVEDAFLRAERRLVLATDLFGAGLDERLDRQDPERQHVE